MDLNWVHASAAADAAALRGMPKAAVAVGLPLLVVVLAGVVSATHATSAGQVSPHVDWLRFQIDDVFTESPLFLLAAIAIGVFSPALGVLLVVVFGVMDLAAAAMQPGELEPLPAALAGRLVAIWLLWLLVVEIPILGRQLGLSWQRVVGNRFAVATLTGVATGGFVWFWTLAATVLVRPVFVWSSLPTGVRLEAIQPVQTAGLAFAVVGGLLAGAVALARGPAGLIHDPARRPAQPKSRGPLALLRRLVGRVVVAALLTVALGGLISVPLEAVALFAALLVARPLARLVADRTSLGRVARALPPIARYAVAAALSFTVAQLTIAPLYQLAAFDSSGNVPQFFSVIVSVAIGIILVELATTPGAPARSRPTAASSVGAAVMLVMVLVVLQLAAPLAVLADNCAGLVDCWGTPFLAALAGGGLPMAMAAASQPPKTPPPAPKPDQKDRDRDFNQKKKDYWTKEADRQKTDPKYKNWPDLQPQYERYIQKQRDYWSNPPPPKSDGKSISPQAVGSSGAGTKA
ncbi:MAG: hypothetical protein ABI841_06715 [Chloroflexota bacterium]